MFIISLRVTDDEKSLIECFTKLKGISVSGFIRFTVIKKLKMK